MALPCLAKLRPTTFVEDATVPRSKIPVFLNIIKKAAKEQAAEEKKATKVQAEAEKKAAKTAKTETKSK